MRRDDASPVPRSISRRRGVTRERTGAYCPRDFGDRGRRGEARLSSRAAGEREDEESGYFRYANGPAGFLPALPPGLPQTRLGTRPVRDIMTRATFSVRPDATLPEAARFLHRTGIHRALVFEGDRLAGVVSLRDVVAAVAGAAEA